LLLPGKITMEQAWQFAKAVARGQEDRWDLMKTLMANKIREVVWRQGEAQRYMGHLFQPDAHSPQLENDTPAIARRKVPWFTW